jgi:carboxypeptidase family protein
VRIIGRIGAAVLAVALSLGACLTARAQGVYTAAVQGTVRGTNHEPLPNVSIVLTNQATGDRWDATTSATGRYAIENVPVGGPYTLRARRVGFAAGEQTRIALGLGQRYVADLTLQPATVQLQTVQVTATKSVLSDATRTGPSSTISDSLVHSEPTIDRDFQSLLEMQPEVSFSQGNLSIAGENNRFNNILIDGSGNNDLFGLADNGLPGGACRNPWQDIINARLAKQFHLYGQSG